VNLIDMRAMMGRSGGGSMMGQDDWRRFRPGMMRVTASPAAVAPGVVSLRVANTGYLRHELVVLALSAGQQVGTRTPGADGKVDEAGSLGEASASCAAGTGGGIAQAPSAGSPSASHRAGMSCSATCQGTTPAACTPNSTSPECRADPYPLTLAL
jgi:hypothetical protein